MISCSSETIANSDYFDYKNQKIFFGNYGDKKNPDVLFIHGLMGSSTSFDEIITVSYTHLTLPTTWSV